MLRSRLRAKRHLQFKNIPKGLTIADVARRLRLSYNITQKWCRACGYAIHPGPAYMPDGTTVRAARKKQVAALPRGLSIPQAAKRMGLSYNITHRWLKEFGYNGRNGNSPVRPRPKKNPAPKKPAARRAK